MDQFERFPAVGDTWRYALIGGLPTIPFTTATYWQTDTEMSFAPLVFGGVLAGYLATRKTGTANGVGVRAGLVGGLPALLIVAPVLRATTALTGPDWFRTMGVGLALLTMAAFTIVALAFAALLGGIGARIGSWIATVGETDPPPSTDA